MSKPGRNDQCHCGSGKKYKKCCLDKDQAESRSLHEEEQRKQVAFENRPSYNYQQGPEYDPNADDFLDEDPMEEISRNFISEFSQLAFADKISNLEEMFKAKDDVISYVAIDTLEELQAAADNGIKRNQVNCCIDLLRKELPEVYSTDLVYYAKFFISNKLAVGNYEGVSFYFNEAAAMAGKNIDTFTELIDMLAYHSQLATLLEGMKIALPNIRNSPDILEWAVDEITVAMSDFETFDYLEKSARNEHPDFEALLGRMRSLLAGFADDKYSDYLTRLKGESSSTWTMDAFVSSKKSADNIGQLSQEFLGYLRHHEGVSYVKGALACFDFADYLFQRSTGELKSGKGKHGSKKGRNNLTNILCPDGGTFDHYLAQKVSMFSQRIYKVGAILEFVPAWLRFLASKGLLENGEKESTLAEIMPFQADWLQVLTKLSSDQALLSGVSTTWDKDPLAS